MLNLLLILLGFFGAVPAKELPSKKYLDLAAVKTMVAAAEAEARKRAESDPLSEREREVLRLLALGHTNQEIAKLLYISIRTAETHRARIMQKLGLSTRAEDRKSVV